MWVQVPPLGHNFDSVDCFKNLKYNNSNQLEIKSRVSVMGTHSHPEKKSGSIPECCSNAVA